MKVLVGLNTKKIEDYLNYTNSFIIGIKGFSISYLDFTIEEVQKLKKDYPNIEIFVSMNKNIFNKDLQELEETLIMIDKIGVNGLLFYDLSILSIVKRLNLHIPLIWGQEHMTTNYNTCNYYYDKGCEYVYLSSEITEEEIKEIKERTKIKLISFLFGYPEVSFSKRKLLTNYFIHNKREKKQDYYLIQSDENNKYWIKEQEEGTSILYGNILNGAIPFFNLKNTLAYGIINECLMEHPLFLECLKIFNDLLKDTITVKEASEKIGKMVNSNDTVFYYKKTIYKVKNEK